MTSNGDRPERDAVLQHLERVLSATPFRQAERSAGLLRYLVRRSLDGAGDRLKEYTVGVEALGRGAEFDPRTDPIVRAEASRLRGRLERYYAGEGQSDVMVIELPKGAYTARFHARQAAAEIPPDEAPAPLAVSSRKVPWDGRRVRWASLGASAILGAFVAGAWSARTSSVAPAIAAHLEVQLQSDERIGSDVGVDVVLAPDGSRVVFISIDSLGETRLRVLRFDGSVAVDLPGTGGARGAFWSPDSRWIGFWAGRQLRKVAVDGGPPIVLCDAPDLLGASWGDGDMIVAALDATKRLWKVNAASSSGTPVSIMDLSAENAAPLWPQILPGGKQVLYTLTGVGADRNAIEVVTLSDGRRKKIVDGGTFGRYMAPGHLTFVNQGTLYAMRFDPSRLETSGPRVPILNDVAYSATFGNAQISVAEAGLAVYRRAPPNGPMIVALVDSTGRSTPLLPSPGQYAWPALSPDGKRLALSVVESGVQNVSIFENLHEHLRLVRTVAGYDSPVWTRDGRMLVARGDSGIVWMPASTGAPRPLIASDKISIPWSFAPDDRGLAYVVVDTPTALDLWTAPLEKRGDTLRAGTPTPIARALAYEAYPAISPDGRWLAYSSDESGSAEVYVRPLADSSIKVPVGHGGVPRWSRSSSRLFFATRDRRIMAVKFTVAGGKFIPDAPRQWTAIELGDTGVLSNYDLGLDDGYIVALLPAPWDKAQASNHVTWIRDLSGEIRRKTP
jgi:Tol biopolymer transport system component